MKEFLRVVFWCLIAVAILITVSALIGEGISKRQCRISNENSAYERHYVDFSGCYFTLDERGNFINKYEGK